MKVLKNIFAIVCLGCMLAVFLLGAADYFNTQIHNYYLADGSVDYDSSWDGTKDYPPESGVEIDEEDSVLSPFEYFAESWTERVSEDSEFYDTAVYLTKWFDLSVGFNVTTSISAVNDTTDLEDIVVDLGDGYLSRIIDPDKADTTGKSSVWKLISFGQSVEEDGRNFLFLLAPVKTEVTDYSGTLSELYPDASVEFADYIMASVEEAGLDAVSIVDEMESDGLATLEAFYKTDHHWTAETGLYVCGLLGETLNSLYDYAIDTSVFDLENYTVTLLEDYWLGSLGRKSSNLYCELEDFTLYIPNYETELTVYRSNTNFTYYGSIQKTLFNYAYLNGSYQTLNFNAYMFYGFGDMAYISVENHDLDDGSHVLLLKNSYSDCMIPYLTTAFQYLDVIDLRYYDGSLEAIIEDIDPDTIVVLYSTDGFADSRLFDFE